MNEKELYQINASLTCIDLSDIKNEMKRINESSIHGFHYDVVDGKFNHCFMFGDRMLPVFKKLTQKPIAVHLACEDPDLYIPIFIQNGADSIIIHYESKCNVLNTIKDCKRKGITPILGFCCDTEVPEDFLQYAKEVNSILKLTVFPGFSGQRFYQPSLAHIQKMHKLLLENGLDIPIEVDGNINKDTIAECVKAGAHSFTGGTSGLFDQRHSLQENIDLLYKKIREAAL